MATLKSYLATRRQANDPQSIRSNLLLDTLVARGNTFKSSHSLQCLTTSPGLVGQHSTYCSLENLGWSTVVERTSSRVNITSFPKEAQKLQLVPKTKRILIGLEDSLKCLQLSSSISW